MYTVVSPKREEYNLFEEFFLSYKKYPIDLLIRENGVSGDHPHLNIIWSETVSKRTQDLTGIVKKHMAKANLPGIESPVLVRTKTIVDFNSLIGGYLQKEANYKVLIDTKKYDIEDLKKKYGKPLLGKLRWLGIMTYSNAPLDVIEYCENNGIDYLKLSTLADKSKGMYMTKSTLCLKLLMKISHVHKIQVHHLFRKVDDIHLGILGYLGATDEVAFDLFS